MDELASLREENAKLQARLDETVNVYNGYREHVRREIEEARYQKDKADRCWMGTHDKLDQVIRLLKPLLRERITGDNVAELVEGLVKVTQELFEKLTDLRDYALFWQVKAGHVFTLHEARENVQWLIGDTAEALAKTTLPALRFKDHE